MPYLDEIEAAIPGLRAFAQALARDRELADDLVQDTLEAALAPLGRPVATAANSGGAADQISAVIRRVGRERVSEAVTA